MIVAFYILSALIVGLAVLAVTASNLVRAALALAFSFFSVAGIFWLLGSPFLAVLQLVINAGAIPIVTIFIVMMTQSRVSRLKSPLSAVWALLVAVPFTVGVLLFLPPATVGTPLVPLGVERLGVELLSERGRVVTLSDGGIVTVQGGAILAFEATALVLLVALVGAVLLARREDATVRSRSAQQDPSQRELADADA